PRWRVAKEKEARPGRGHASRDRISLATLCTAAHSGEQRQRGKKSGRGNAPRERGSVRRRQGYGGRLARRSFSEGGWAVCHRESVRRKRFGDEPGLGMRATVLAAGVRASRVSSSTELGHGDCRRCT